MKVKKGGRVNPSKSSKGLPRGDNFFVPKKSTAKPATGSSSDNFFVQKRDPAKRRNPNQDEEKAATRSHNTFKRKPDKNEKSNKDDAKKKTFDKKKWRLQKYSNKYKVEQWEEKRKVAVLRDYRKQVAGDVPKLDVHKIYEEYADDIAEQEEETTSTPRPQGTCSTNSGKAGEIRRIQSENENNTNTDSKRFTRNSKPDKDQAKKKIIPFKKARMAFEKTKKDREEKKQEFLKKKNEREEALKLYKEKKLLKSKKLNQKTKKGQPIMKGRIEMLLEQIQASKASDN